MNHHPVRVRFAPSPTGFMHLGNVRAAVINYLFAKQNKGTFILRIEDTDEQRNVDPRGNKIMSDLQWLDLTYDEGPIKGGSYLPYYQSERNNIYKSYLEKLKEKKVIYKCFCTVGELEIKKERQLALKLPPRYDRSCFKLSEKEIEDRISKNIPHIWRFKLDETKTVTFYDMAKKTVSFDLKNFSDFAITRQDHSFTFIFANFVDDMVMKISHVFRGEDHFSNTANQIALYETFNAQIPIFWHLPIIFNQEGKKLSKRDFGFSLNDLKNGGFLPEAICNYLTIIGGGVFKKEIMTKEELEHAIDFNNISSTGQVHYDLEKLKWVNHQWIKNYNTNALTALCHPYLKAKYPPAETMLPSELIPLIGTIQNELFTLSDVVNVLEFYFKEPEISYELLKEYNIEKYKNNIKEISNIIITQFHDIDLLTKNLQNFCKINNLAIKDIFTLLRLGLTGKAQGSSIKDIFVILGAEKTHTRLQIFLKYVINS